MLYYVYGCVWAFELTTAIGHFLLSYLVISWYYIKKDGTRKVPLPNWYVWNGFIDIIFVHFGSMCFGAAIIPWTRIIRILNWFEEEPDDPQEEGADATEAK